MIDASANLNLLWASMIIEELVRTGVRHFCLSSGSRCAPLTVAAARNDRAQTILHFDERGAAFHALGIAKGSGKPAALICTSGTASANYLPAIIEASMSGVPLVVLTADRPSEMISTGANQTIEQTRLFDGYLRWQFLMPPPSQEVPPETVLTMVDQAVYKARRAPGGPVHINCPFREPLSPVRTGHDFTSYLSTLETWRNHADPFTQYVESMNQGTPDGLERVVEAIEGAERGVILAGSLSSMEEAAAVVELSRHLGWPLLPDVASSIRFGAHSDFMASYYDVALQSTAFNGLLRPDVALQIGGAITSKRLNQHLESYGPRTFIHAANHPGRLDPNHRVTLRIETGIAAFCNQLTGHASPNLDLAWRDELVAVSAALDTFLNEFMGRHRQVSEPALARTITQLAPRDSILFAGNSMPIRDLDMYGAAQGHSLRVMANRGASGIDGCVATAAGLAVGSGKPVTAFLGDLAMLHDVNSLPLARKAGVPVIYVVVNNDGGGIFHFLPIARYAGEFEPYFATPHGFHFDAAGDLFDVAHVSPVSMDLFKTVYKSAIERGGATIIEIHTSRAQNVNIHKMLNWAVRRAVDG
ncbi:MAG: 2-succinyl-5-enolpyruvyl-6-hydroxy-3-cyclohexene-1-carboxylic-acid synthase [Candidatus Hydrogenedentes bacterium]|nr:2-succinyl-5-enolpyruvyl-6-hydroxy-3-cyclohexene-1-carboxylic-acid synthase [Candidatus Hydrogenedentota bacterium]